MVNGDSIIGRSITASIYVWFMQGFKWKIFRRSSSTSLEFLHVRFRKKINTASITKRITRNMNHITNLIFQESRVEPPFRLFLVSILKQPLENKISTQWFRSNLETPSYLLTKNGFLMFTAGVEDVWNVMTSFFPAKVQKKSTHSSHLPVILSKNKMGQERWKSFP